MSTPKPRTRLSPEARAEQIMQAAIAVAREDGLGSLSLRAVAARAGVAAGLITHYEPSVDDLVARVFVAITTEELRELIERTEAITDPSEALRTLIHALLTEARDDVTLAWVESYALGRRNEALATAVTSQMQGWMHYVAGLVRAGISTGAFTVADAEDAAWQLIGMIDGLNAQALLRRTDAELFVAQMARASEAILGAEPGSLSG